MTDSPLVVRGFLAVRSDGTLRVTKTNPHLRLDEMAFPLSVTIPRTWGKVQAASIEVELPEPPAARVTVGDAEMTE